MLDVTLFTVFENHLFCMIVFICQCKTIFAVRIVLKPAPLSSGIVWRERLKKIIMSRHAITCEGYLTMHIPQCYSKNLLIILGIPQLNKL